MVHHSMVEFILVHLAPFIVHHRLIRKAKRGNFGPNYGGLQYTSGLYVYVNPGDRKACTFSHYLGCYLLIDIIENASFYK